MRQKKGLCQCGKVHSKKKRQAVLLPSSSARYVRVGTERGNVANVLLTIPFAHVLGTKQNAERGSRTEMAQ